MRSVWACVAVALTSWGCTSATEDRDSDAGEVPAGDAGESLGVRQIDLGGGQVALAVAVGGGHACALLQGGQVKCWGNAYAGRLGGGQGYEYIGDQPEELGDALLPVDLGSGESAAAIGAGYGHACAVLASGALKCWGHGGYSQLGLGDRENRGDEPGEMGDALPAVELGAGRTAQAVSLGGDHTCALLDGGAVKCWGIGQSGRLGLGMPLDNRGDEPGEMGDALPEVDLGSSAIEISIGGGHSCARMSGGVIKCWGSGPMGQLGQGDREDRGDVSEEMGAALPAVDLAGAAVQVAAGGSTSCALLSDGSVKCWGNNELGQLGQGDANNRGDDPGEMGEALRAIDLGGAATAVAVGNNHACAVLASGDVGCWGSAESLGLPQNVGNQPTALSAVLHRPRMPRGLRVLSVSAGLRESCALLEGGSVACWGAQE